jgi:PAS domain S-box-containing protein
MRRYNGAWPDRRCTGPGALISHVTKPFSTLFAGHDWAGSVLGASETWPPAIRTVVRLMLDSKHPMFVVWGPELGMLYNEAYAHFLQDKHPAALGRPFRIVWSELWEQLQHLVERTLAGESVYIEDMPLLMHRRGRDEQTWFTFSYSPVYDDGGAIVGLVGAATDTTRRVTTERRLAFQLRMADQLRGLSDPYEIARRASVLLGEELKADRVLFAEIELDENEVVFHSNYTDGSLPMLKGVFAVSDFGKGLFDKLKAGRTSVHDDIAVQMADEPDTVKNFQQVQTNAEIGVPILRDGKLRSILIVNQRSAREWSPHEIALAEDVAERTWNAVERARAENALRSANRKLEALLTERTAERDRLWVISQDILAVASTDGYFLSCNPAMTQILGWTEAELQVTPFAEFAHPDQAGELETVLSQLAAGRSITQYEIRSRHRDGSWRWLSWTVVPQGRLLYMAGRDVTEEKARREALQQAEDALRQAQKMESIGQLTGGLAHDFNNMLAGVVGNLQLARFHLDQGRTAKLRPYLDGAEGAAHRAAGLTHRLLAFARRQTLDPQPTDVNRLVASMRELIARTAGPAIAVRLELGSGGGVVCCDPNQLESALLNLAINARDAMPDGGELRIRTEDAVLGELPHVRICVTDDGTGMSADVAARVFEPFFTTKPIGEGTGLGLSMVYGFVSQSGGQVGLRSEPGQGTTVSIDLPQYRGVAQEQAPAPPLAALAHAHRATLLLVDDEEPLRAILAELLRDAGHEVLEAASAAAALDQADGRSIDALITDVGLPGGMNGRQLAAAVRDRHPGIGVLFVTGYAESAVLNKGALEPGMHIMTKPFALTDFAARVARMVAASAPPAR